MQQGVVAQLGERLLDVQEVCGSSPHGPTLKALSERILLAYVRSVPKHLARFFTSLVFMV